LTCLNIWSSIPSLALWALLLVRPSPSLPLPLSSLSITAAPLYFSSTYKSPLPPFPAPFPLPSPPPPPSGYVGFEDGGQLTEAVRRRPYSVVLFDEMEKAHPDVFNILLQLLDDGRLTDSKGNLVNFRNTIVIFTSNVGSQDILDIDPSDSEKVRDRVMAALQAKFRPEFLNRIDEFVTFKSLGREQLAGIVSIELERVSKRLIDRELTLSVTEGAKAWLAERGYDPVYGARPLKRTIQREVETPVAKMLLAGSFPSGSAVFLDARPGDPRLTITSVPAAGAGAGAGAGAEGKMAALPVSSEGNILQ